MTKEEAKLVLDNARPQTKEIDRQFYDDEDLNNALDMAIKALEIVEEFEKAQIITGGRLNGRTYAYKCGLEDGKRKALEQQPSDDIMAIHTQGLDEGIRCAMCTNSMKSDTGCDGGCSRVDNDMYKKVMDTIKNHIVPPVTPTHGTCKGCKHYYIDEDGHGYHCEKFDYTRFPVYADFYCANYEKRGNKVGWSSLENVREKVERGSENEVN